MSLWQGVSLHPDTIRLIGHIDCSVHHIWKFGYGIQSCREKLQLLQSRHVGDEEDYAGMHFESLITAPEFKGVVCDQNPVFLCHNFEDVPIF